MTNAQMNPLATPFRSLTCALALLLGAAATALGADSKTAPNWELKDLEGKIAKSADYKGKVIVLDFWATWCGPCKKEIPAFIELQDQYGKDGLVIVGVSLDDGAKVVKKFVASNKINYPIVMGDDAITKAFGGVEGIPTTFIINREGKIVSKHVGYTDKAVFEKEIKPLLQAAK